MAYTALKHLHISCAFISYLLFLSRGILMLRDSPALKQRWLKVTPHLVDTVLLASAIALTVTINQYPFADAWLTAKLCALLLYIVLGSIALKRGKTRSTRIAAWLAAQAVFAYIVLVAIKHDPTPFAG
ncbi:MAG: SirB2 family protein [Nitrosomonadales bacterium]|nr:SirB2 family protein [Nitrosomonadales bacterium]